MEIRGAKMRSTLPTDSYEYEILCHAAAASASLKGLTCEIGVRAGGSSELILRASMEHRPSRPHIAIDPYGSLPYVYKGVVQPYVYDDAMRREAIKALHEFALTHTLDFMFLPWKDTDFLERCATGVPFYTEAFPDVTCWTEYALVHIDGPHDLESVQRETEFFASRMMNGGWLVYDDVSDYDHQPIDELLRGQGFIRSDIPLPLTRPSPKKASYRKDV